MAERIRRMMRSEDAEPRYFHPAGYVLQRETRDWDMRGYRDTIGSSDPKVMWIVRRHASKRILETFTRLADARAWCDEKHHRQVSDA